MSHAAFGPEHVATGDRWLAQSIVGSTRQLESLEVKALDYESHLFIPDLIFSFPLSSVSSTITFFQSSYLLGEYIICYMRVQGKKSLLPALVKCTEQEKENNQTK